MKDHIILPRMANCIRVLAADAVEKAKSGHPGMPLGMADVMTCLAANHLRFNPHDPRWLGRDRLILSAGHGCMLLYAFYYLSGYKYFDLEQIKQFRQLHSRACGHPEYFPEFAKNDKLEKCDLSPIELTTGPLGQGLATSVGMAIAAKKYQSTVNKDLASYKIYTIVGDGCLMEGISQEACSLAAHLNLKNLVILFDDNRITIDGRTNLTTSENHIERFRALGFEVDQIDAHNFNEINAALIKAQHADKPYFIACKSIIAYGCNKKKDSSASHGAPLGKDEIEYLKKYLNWPKEPFFIPEDLLAAWRSVWKRNQNEYESWYEKFSQLSMQEKSYLSSKNSNQIELLTLKQAANSVNNQATRVSSSIILESLVKQDNKIIVGSADLSSSNGINISVAKKITKDDFSGNFLHYGIREHAMAAVMNGLALERFIPVGGTFLVFSDYMKPAIRLSAMMRLGVIYLFTHDSIGVGEDGPTHQPIEHLSSLRAIPNTRVFRPADFIETVECWDLAIKLAVKESTSPVILSLTRQNVPQIRKDQNAKINLCQQGHYIVEDDGNHVDVIIFATGSELDLAVKVKALLNNQRKKVRVFSVPFTNNLNNPDIIKLDHITDSQQSLKVAIEAGSSCSWYRLLGFDGLYININEFGLSAPNEKLFDYYGFTTQKILQKIIQRL